MVLAAVTQWGDAIRFAAPDLQVDGDVVRAAMCESAEPYVGSNSTI